MFRHKQKSRDPLWSHDLVGFDFNNNGRDTASEHSWLCKTLNLLINQQIISLILAAYGKNMSLVHMGVFNEGDNTLELRIRSLNVPMEISIGDLTF